jgi:tungstate transport system substrate-binding protein
MCTIVLVNSAFLSTTQAADNFIVVQSTTSTQNSGLLEYILPTFTAKTGIVVRVVAVGTGQAIKNARNGDGDVLFVHATQAEEKFIADGDGIKRSDVMYNDFIIVGPPGDPAGLAGLSDVRVALLKLASAKALFASRGDDSGTHKKERSLWKEVGIDPGQHRDQNGGKNSDKNSGQNSSEWYRETGSGMGTTLNTAVGLAAYVMTDRATWIAFRNKADFKIHVEGDPRLFNQYGIILVNPKKHPHIKAALAQQFIDWLLSSPGQRAIANYKLNGRSLFFPNAGS